MRHSLMRLEPGWYSAEIAPFFGFFGFTFAPAATPAHLSPQLCSPSWVHQFFYHVAQYTPPTEIRRLEVTIGSQMCRGTGTFCRAMITNMSEFAAAKIILPREMCWTALARGMVTTSLRLDRAAKKLVNAATDCLPFARVVVWVGQSLLLVCDASRVLLQNFSKWVPREERRFVNNAIAVAEHLATKQSHRVQMAAYQALFSSRSPDPTVRAQFRERLRVLVKLFSALSSCAIRTLLNS